MMKYL